MTHQCAECKGIVYGEQDLPDVVNSPGKIFELEKGLGAAKQEHVKAILLDVRLRVIKRVTVSIGTSTESLCHARDVFREAIKRNAFAIALVHNHPSGDPIPSEADKVLTGKVKAAGDLLGIKLLDHVIIGKGSYYSFQAQGAL